MKKLVSLLLILVTIPVTKAQEIASDSIYQVERVEVTAIKQGLNLRQEPLSSSVLSAKTVEQYQVAAISDLQNIVPNFYMPDYGSRITSSIYVRGLGARIDNPVVGLNIDNVPLLNKNAFDNDVTDIERVEMLRGPQSTLYGRNTMGGVINIYTLSPMSFQGTKLGTEYSSGNTYRLRASHYAKLSNRLAASLGLYYGSSDGLFENEYTGEMCDTEQEMGGRLRVQYMAAEHTMIDNTLSMSRLNQGGYPYMSLESGKISYNDPCSYDRTMVNYGMTISSKRDDYTITGITSYQYLDDDMRLDQDFSPESIFTLQQATREHAVTEDIVVKSRNTTGYNHLCGAFILYKHQTMRAPVTFKEAGIEQLILDNINNSTSTYVWDSDSFVLDSDFTNQTLGAAIYHESSYKQGRWEIAGAIRLDYEMAMLDYHSYTDTGCKRYNTAGEMTWDYNLPIDLNDNTTLDFLTILPRVSAKYRLDAFNSLYATVSRGYKAGGFNTQMFSDILQQELMSRFGLSSPYSVEDIITYKPEYSWNYEIGAHLTNRSRTITADVALFYIDCTDQQLTLFLEDMVTGRMMTNAGKSRSFGAELSMGATLGRLRLNGSYGYTDARFVEYDDNEENYAGNYVPYSPKHTLYGAITYSIPIRTKWLESIELETNTNGAGEIYWREDNTLSQPLYALLGAAIRLNTKHYTLSLWGRNLTDKSYNTFYFESMGNEFVQQARPMTLGATLSITL